MNKEELAKILDNSEYPLRFSKELRATLKASGLVVVHGASDDLMEFDGAIHDEVECCDGGDFLIDCDGVLPENMDDIDEEEEILEYLTRKKTALKIEALWDQDGYSWTYKTDISHSVFNINEDSEPYCRGMIFSLSDIKAAQNREDVMVDIDWKKVAEDNSLSYHDFESQILMAAFAVLVERLKVDGNDREMIQIKKSGHVLLFKEINL